MTDEDNQPGGGPDRNQNDDPANPQRRFFLQATAGGVVGAAGLFGVGGLLAWNGDHNHLESELHPVGRPEAISSNQLVVNGRKVNIKVPDQRTLLLALREDLGLTGTKKGCNLGQCGACTVHMDGKPVYSCMMLARDAVGHEVTTIEGLEKNGRLHPVQKGFIEKWEASAACAPAG